MKKLWLGTLVLGSLLAQEQNPLEVRLTEEGKLDKNGILVGVDLGFGFGRGSSVAVSTGTQVRISDFEASIKNYDSKKLFVGYQKYLENVRQLGLNVKATLGLEGFQLRHVMVRDVMYWMRPTRGETIIENFTPFSVGAEANLLYDFYEKGKNVVGLNLGLGYEFVHAFNTGVGFDNTTGANGTILSMYEPLFGERAMNYFLITPKLGLHYYYDHHQIGVDVRFSKVLNMGAPMVKKVRTPSFDGQSMFRVELSHFLTFRLNYAYRF